MDVEQRCRLITRSEATHCPAGVRTKKCCHYCDRIESCEQACLNSPDKCNELTLYTGYFTSGLPRKRNPKRSIKERIEMVMEHRNGMSYTEIAQKHDIHKSTARQWILELEQMKERKDK